MGLEPTLRATISCLHINESDRHASNIHPLQCPGYRVLFREYSPMVEGASLDRSQPERPH